MKKLRVIIPIVVIAVFIASACWYFFLRNKPEKTTPSTQPVVQKNEQNELDPIIIEAIRTRTYTASQITAEQNLGNQGGYTNSIVSYTSDGHKIYALLSTPTGTKPDDGWPVVVFDHGYIDPTAYRTNGTDYQNYIAALARAGYVVIKPDYRGHGNSQGSPDGGHFSPVYAYDNLNLIESLKKYPLVNPQRIGLFGHSLGGHVALRTIVTNKDIKATVLAAGVTGSFYDILYNWPNSPMPGDMPTQLVAGNREALLKKYGDPKANPTFWDSASSINYVDYISGPVQVHHSLNDSIVPQSFSGKLVEALRRADKVVQYYTYQGDDHQFSRNRSTFLQHIVEFYKNNL